MRLVSCTVCGVLLAVAAGCASRGYVPIAYYALHPEVQASPLAPSGKSLGLRPLLAGRAYGDRMAFLVSGHELAYYEHAAWADYPRDVFAKALLDGLVATGHFTDVGNAADMARPDFILTGELRRFEEVRTETPPVALCEVRLEMRTFGGREAVWAGTLSARAPLQAEGPGALAAAMETAVGRLASEAVAQIAAH